jgi:dTDP-4-dehydrorhamnose reductase
VKKKLVITGASGFLGYHLLRSAAADWEIYGITLSKNFAFDGATQISCDIRNYIELGNYLDDIEPDALIHAAAISDSNFCQQNEELAHEVNVGATINLAGICSDYNIPFAFTSTDLVFDGTKGMYTETDSKNPVNVYGEQKSIAEDEVLRIYPEATIFRLPMMFGFAAASSNNYLQKFLAQIESGTETKLFSDEYRSVCGAESVSRGILQLLEKERGVIHLGGKERLSRYEFALKAADVYGLDKTLIKSCLQKDVQMAAPRPADVSLDISKAKELGFTPLNVVEELTLVAQAGNSK